MIAHQILNKNLSVCSRIGSASAASVKGAVFGIGERALSEIWVFEDGSCLHMDTSGSVPIFSAFYTVPDFPLTATTAAASAFGA